MGFSKAAVDAVTSPRLTDVSYFVIYATHPLPFLTKIQNFKPLHGVCEFLSALHIYTDEASQGVTRYIEATHFCSHVRKGN